MRHGGTVLRVGAGGSGCWGALALRGQAVGGGRHACCMHLQLVENVQWGLRVAGETAEAQAPALPAGTGCTAGGPT